MSLKKSTFVYSFLLFCTLFCLWGQNKGTDLSRRQPDWVAVLGGNLLCEPVQTEAGYVAVGEGKMLHSFTGDGKILWQKGFSKRLSPFVTSGVGGMLYVVTGGSKLDMLNPGGTPLWTSDTGFNIENAPLAGRDGRVFVRGRDALACYGLNGKRRWILKIKGQNIQLPVTTLNDGSLLVFLDRTAEGNKSVAITVTPFGDSSEEITFAGKVIQSVPCKDGALLSFSDSSLGMVSSDKGKAFSKWTLPPQKSGITGPAKIACCHGENKAWAVWGTPATLTLFRTADGTVSRTFTSSVRSAKELKMYSPLSKSIVLADANRAACFDEQGETLWNIDRLPPKDWNFALFTDTGYITLCTRSWVLEGYRIVQSLFSQKPKAPKKNVSSYREFYDKTPPKSDSITGAAINADKAKEIERAFSKGDFGEKEHEWLAVLEAEISKMRSDWLSESWDYTVQKPYFKANVPYNATILSLCAKSGISLGQENIPSLLKSCDDPTVMISLVRYAAEAKFDPEGQILYTLDYIARNKARSDDSTLLCEIATACTQICLFMGRPAFFSQGRALLTYMMYPQFSSKVRDTARSCLEQIASSGL